MAHRPDARWGFVARLDVDHPSNGGRGRLFAGVETARWVVCGVWWCAGGLLWAGGGRVDRSRLCPIGVTCPGLGLDEKSLGGDLKISIWPRRAGPGLG
jgi:hypothetical protein